jgi:RHS repeat-associated protein
MLDGSFGIAGVPVNSGQNLLTAIVQDVSGNSATNIVNFTVGNSQISTFSYDPNGNLSSVSSASSVLNYSYDAENRLTTVTSNGVTVLQCWYDGFGRRIAKREIIGTQTNTWQYVWDGWNLIAVLGSDGSLKEFYTRGVGIAGDIGTLVAATHYTAGSPSATYYLHNNHRGDVIMARQGTTTVATLDYTPYGELRSFSGTYVPRFRFSSKEYDSSTGFYHFPYRYYAPQWARWLTKDPLYEGNRNPMLLRPPDWSTLLDARRMFVYVANNPLRYRDPTGLSLASDFCSAFIPGDPADPYICLNGKKYNRQCLVNACANMVSCMLGAAGTGIVNAGICGAGCLVTLIGGPISYGGCFALCTGADAIATIINAKSCWDTYNSQKSGCESL